MQQRIDNVSPDFNFEELFFMNRIAFRLFKRRGPKLQFEEFRHDLTTMQDGTFEESLDLWLKLCVEVGD